ncbi:MAG TPA: amidohydrolase [Terrimicrobiaceae bacterium]
MLAIKEAGGQIAAGGSSLPRISCFRLIAIMPSRAAPQSSSLFKQLDSCVMRLAPELAEIRRHLHANPELSGTEYASTAFVAKRLKAAGILHEAGPDGRGIITAISGPSIVGAPVIALRADLDALPIAEENDVPYRSRNVGVMHACGHDVHSAILLGTLCALRSAEPIPVGWRGIFQPSEEAGHGAREMMARGALAGVDAIIALHVDPTIASGQLALTAGPQTAFCQDFEIEVRGRGGHGARPHHTVDPIAIAAQLVTLIYQALPRKTDARDPLVVTIGQIQGGHATNVIPDTATIKGTVRALDSVVSRNARRIITKLSRGIAQAFGGEVRVTFDTQLPGVVNDPAVTAICVDAARDVVGADHVLVQGRPSMGAEDFAEYLSAVPGCMIRLGVRRRGRKITPLHTSTFDIDEDALVIGASFLAKVLLYWPRVSR